MTSSDILTALAKRYTAPEYAFFTDVRNSVGFTKARTADAMAMSLYPSRGLHMIGFEIKVSRADWKRELAQPDKAEALAQFCRNWFVAAPYDMIGKEEMPTGWGLIGVKDDGSLRYAKPAPDHTPAEPSWMFFASLCRDVTEDWIPRSVYDKRVASEVETARAEWLKNQGYEMRRLKEELAKVTDRIAKFEETSGIKLDRYSEYFQGEIGKAVASIRKWSHGPVDQLAIMQANVGKLEREIGEVIEAIKAGRVAEVSK